MLETTAENVLAAVRRLAMAVAMVVLSSLPTVAKDLPSFLGDGRDTSHSALRTTFTQVRALPDEQVREGDVVRDWASLQEILATQEQVVAKIKPSQTDAVDGVSRPVTAQDLARMIELLKHWHGNGRPLGEIADAYLLKGDGQGNVRFAGYFTPSITVTETPSARYRFPLYRKPTNRPEPLPTRREINEGALADSGLELAWTDSLEDLYVLQVQGIRLRHPSRRPPRPILLRR